MSPESNIQIKTEVLFYTHLSKNGKCPMKLDTIVYTYAPRDAIAVVLDLLLSMTVSLPLLLIFAIRLGNSSRSHLCHIELFSYIGHVVVDRKHLISMVLIRTDN